MLHSLVVVYKPGVSDETGLVNCVRQALEGAVVRDANCDPMAVGRLPDTSGGNMQHTVALASHDVPSGFEHDELETKDSQQRLHNRQIDKLAAPGRLTVK